MAQNTQRAATRRTYSSAAYQRERAELLAEGPKCTFPGCRRKATEADHFPALADHDHVPGSGCCQLRPLCKPHNAGLGAHVANRKAQARKAAARSNPRAAIHAARPAPVRGAPVSPLALEPEGDPAIGRDEPWYATPIRPGCDTYGPAVRVWGEEHLSGKRPWVMMPWQALALDRQLAHVDGNLVHDQALTSTARQNGKTVGGLQPLVGWWLTERCKIADEPQSVLTTSHKLPAASRFFHQLAPLLEIRFGARLWASYGREHLELPCGCEWTVTAATPSAGHSTTNHLVVADELWGIGSECFDDGLVPTTRAVRSSLVSCWSTAGTEGSEVMLRLREQGLRAIDTGEPGSLCLSSWEIPTGVDPMDERWWRYANPAMGKPQTGLTLATLRSESRNPKRNAFLRAALNRWVSSDRAWLEEGVWNALAA